MSIRRGDQKQETEAQQTGGPETGPQLHGDVRGHRAKQTQGWIPSRWAVPIPKCGSIQTPEFPDFFFFFLTLQEVMLNGCGWCLRGPDWDRESLKVQITEEGTGVFSGVRCSTLPQARIREVHPEHLQGKCGPR